MEDHHFQYFIVWSFSPFFRRHPQKNVPIMASKLATEMGGLKLNLWPEAENCVLSESFGNLPATSHNYDLLNLFAGVSHSLPCIRAPLLDDAVFLLLACFSSSIRKPAIFFRCQLPFFWSGKLSIDEAFVKGVFRDGWNDLLLTCDIAFHKLINLRRPSGKNKCCHMPMLFPLAWSMQF